MPREMKKHKLKRSLKEKRGCWVTTALSAPGEKHTELSFILMFFVNTKGSPPYERKYNNTQTLAQWPTADKFSPNSALIFAILNLGEASRLM